MNIKLIMVVHVVLSTNKTLSTDAWWNMVIDIVLTIAINLLIVWF